MEKFEESRDMQRRGSSQAILEAASMSHHGRCIRKAIGELDHDLILAFGEMLVPTESAPQATLHFP